MKNQSTLHPRENPLLSDPNAGKVREELKNLDLLVVQDIFLTETAELAHVVLPGVSFAEKMDLHQYRAASPAGSEGHRACWEFKS